MLLQAIATISLGRSSAGHGIVAKIQEAALNGFSGVEIFYECLESYACEIESRETNPSRGALREAAQRVHEVCKEASVAVVCLQPFINFDGLADEDSFAEKLEVLHFWFELCRLLHTDLIQIPTNFGTPGSVGDLDRIASDCRTAAELGMRQSPAIRFAYEAVAWGKHLDTWESTWEVVKRVDMANFGLCLDVFHIAGRVWADPSAESGVVEGGDADLQRSLESLVRDVDPGKIFYVQVGDAERLEHPVAPGFPLFQEGVNPRMSWSRNARLFAFEEDLGGFLPVAQVCEAIFTHLGWAGWVSAEMFHRNHHDPDPELVRKLASRAARSWSNLLAVMKQELAP